MMFVVLQAGIGTAVGLAAEVAAAIAFVSYYAVPIYLAIIITVYELLLKFDIATTVQQATQTAFQAIAGSLKIPNRSQISILPAEHKANTEGGTLISYQTPFNMLFNINRAFLYFGFVITLIILFPFNLVVGVPAFILVTIFSFISTVILFYEPLIIGPLIILALLDLLTDIIVDFAKTAR